MTFISNQLTDFSDSVRSVRQFRNQLSVNSESLSRILSDLRFCDPVECLLSEIMPLIAACRYLEKQGRAILKPVRHSRMSSPWWLGGHSVEIVRAPLGHILILSPSNYPLMLAGIQLIQGLFAGNRMTLKPSPGAMDLWNFIATLLSKAGFHPDRFQIADASPDELDRCLELGTDLVIMTGGHHNGRVVQQKAAKAGVPVILELSGWDPFIIGPDADPKVVIQALNFGVRLNNSRTCIAPHRIFIPRNSYSEYIGLLASHDWSGIHVPNLSAGHMKSIQSAIAESTAQGAGLLWGDLEQLDTWPLVLTNCHPDMPVCQEDLFVPLLALIPYGNDKDLASFVNRCPFALGASIFSRDQMWAQGVASSLEAGVVTINDVVAPTADPRIPFTGFKASGHGVTRGPDGLLSLTRPRTVLSQSHKIHRHYQSVPDFLGPFMHRLLELTGATSISQKFTAARKLVHVCLSVSKKNQTPNK